MGSSCACSKKTLAAANLSVLHDVRGSFPPSTQSISGRATHLHSHRPPNHGVLGDRFDRTACLARSSSPLRRKLVRIAIVRQGHKGALHGPSSRTCFGKAPIT